MRDANGGPRISSALSHVLTEISTLSNARLGAICDIAPSGLLRLLALRSNPKTINSQHSVVTVYAPAVILNSVVAERVQLALRSTRPHVVSLPPDDITELVANLGETHSNESDNSVLVIPSRSGTLGIILIGPQPWSTPPLSYLRMKFDEATDEYDFLSGARTSDQITRLLVELSGAVSESRNSSQGASKICDIIGKYFEYRSVNSFSFEDDRLLLFASSKPLNAGDNPGPLHPALFNGLSTIAKRAFETRTIAKVNVDTLSDLPIQIRRFLDLTGESLILPLLRGDHHVGVIVISNKISGPTESIFEHASATILMRHLSLLFSQLIEDYEKDVRIRASSSISPMLDATTQIISTSEMGAFLSRSLALCIDSPAAFFFLLDDHKYVSEICPAGSEVSGDFEPDITWTGKLAGRFSFFSQLSSSHEPIFFEPSMAGAYPSEIRDLLGSAPYVAIPISTSEGLIGFALASQPKNRPFWSIFDKSTIVEWSVSATLVADNVGLRLAERLHLANYKEKAFKDSLTGLPNRELFMDRLSVATVKAQRSGASTAVVFIDIDYFKNVNDTYGHRTGDELLIQFAKRLTTSFRDTDTVARLSGDEFVVLVENSPPENELLELAQRAFSRVNDTYRIFHDQISVSTSMGIAIGKPGTTGSELLDRADEYMYRSKEAGRGRLTVFSIASQSASTHIDLRSSTFEQTSKSNIAASPTAWERGYFDFSDLYLRFNTDYVELARLRVALAGIIEENRSSNASSLGSEPKEVHDRDYPVTDFTDLRTEFISVRQKGTVDDTKPLDPLGSLLDLGPIGLEHLIKIPRKLLVPINGIGTEHVSALTDMVSEFKSLFQKRTLLLLGISAMHLNNEPRLLEAISTLALRHRCEIMITDVNHRTVRFHDVLMPMVNYLGLPSQFAEQKSILTTPNELSALYAIARDRGIRLVAQDVSNARSIDSLLLAGFTVISGPALSLATKDSTVATQARR